MDTTPTPLDCVRLGDDTPAVWCKLEYLNPSGSTKDRIARYILRHALDHGLLAPGGRVIEASSGSTSIAMARECAELGLGFTAVLPAGVSSERLLIIRAYGGDIVRSPHGEGIGGAIALAERLGREQGAFLPRQFENPLNAEAHSVGTAGELARELRGGVSGKTILVVSGVGTGGTLAGLSAGLKLRGARVIPVMALPVSHGTPVAGGCFGDAESCSYSARIPGVVDGLSRILDPEHMAELVRLEIDDDRAIDTTRALIRKGYPVGPSSGLNYAAAEAAAGIDVDAIIVTVFPDRMERYFSTELFAPARAADD